MKRLQYRLHRSGRKNMQNDGKACLAGKGSRSLMRHDLMSLDKGSPAAIHRFFLSPMSSLGPHAEASLPGGLPVV